MIGTYIKKEMRVTWTLYLSFAFVILGLLGAFVGVGWGLWRVIMWIYEWLQEMECLPTCA